MIDLNCSKQPLQLCFSLKPTESYVHLSFFGYHCSQFPTTLGANPADMCEECEVCESPALLKQQLPRVAPLVIVLNSPLKTDFLLHRDRRDCLDSYGIIHMSPRRSLEKR